MNEQNIQNLVRLARGVEAGGYYNFAKLLWAFVYSKEVQSSNALGVPRGAELISELQALLDDLEAQGAAADVRQAIMHGITAVQEDRIIVYEDIPHVYVSRTNGELFVGRPDERTSSGDDPLDLREFLPVYYLDAMKPDAALQALRTFPGMITAMVEGLSEAQLNQPPAAGEWSVRELFWHFAMAQKVFEGRVEQMVAEESGTLQSVAVWTIQSEGLSTAEILSLYRDSRQNALNMMAANTLDVWGRTFWHDEFGDVTFLQQASYFARHERSHLAQLVAIIDAVSG